MCAHIKQTTNLLQQLCVNATKLTKHFDTNYNGNNNAHNNDNGKQCGEQKNREEKEIARKGGEDRLL